MTQPDYEAVDLGGTPITDTTPVVAGPRGPAGADGNEGPTGFTANGALSGHRVVVPTGSQVEYADNTDLTDIGKPAFLTTGAAMDGQPVTLVARGLVTEPSWAWTPGLVYAGANGVPTQTPPTSGYLRVIGEALSTTTVWVDPRPPFILT